MYRINKRKDYNVIYFDTNDSPVILIKSICKDYFEVWNGGLVTYEGNNYNAAFKEFKKECERLKGIPA